MALKRVTKSIPLAGGIQDEAQEFLLQPPGMSYIENGRFRKKDAVEKTEPVTSLGATGLNADKYGEPYFLHSWNNTLTTVGKNNVAQYYTDSAGDLNWTLKATTGTVLGVEKVLSTAAAAGATNFQWTPCGIYNTAASPDSWDINGYVVAFEIRSLAGNINAPDPEISVVVQRYSIEGVFLDETLFDGFTSPIIQPLPNGTCILYMADFNAGTTFGDVFSTAVFPYPTAIPALTSRITAIRTVCQGFDGSFSWNGLQQETYRLGFSFQAVFNAAYKMKQPRDLTHGVIAWKDHTTGDILYRETDSSGLPTGSTHFVIGQSYPTITPYILDVATDATYNYILYAITDVSAAGGLTDVFVDRYNKSTPGTLDASFQLVNNETGTVFQGSVEPIALGAVWTAFTQIQGRIDSTFNHDDDYLQFDLVNSTFTSATVTKKLRNQCLASNLVVAVDTKVYAVVQQFGSFQPDAGGINVQAYDITPAAIKPVTSVLVQVDNTGAYSVISAFDAGQSKVQFASCAEQTIHYGHLCYVDGITDVNSGAVFNHDFFYCNRNILTAEDYSFWVGTSPGPLGQVGSRSALQAGEAKANLFHCSPTLPVAGASFGESFVLGSGIPLWFDGGLLGELSVLDQPEITSIIDNTSTPGNGPTSITYSPIGAQDYKVFQVVVGYYDRSGNAHRSAPSFPVYAHRLLANFSGGTNSTTNNVIVFVTPPLTFLGSARQYFIEYYVGEIGEELKLAATKTYDAGAQTFQEDSKDFYINLNPSSVAVTQDLVRQSEFLYTTGNVLPADPWPNFEHFTVTSRRMFATSVSAPGVIFYSKIFEENLAPEFSASLVISLGASRNLTAIGQVDDKVIVFEKNAMHVIYGTGPDNTGANGDFFTETINTPLGCEDQESVITTPDGLMFYSSVIKGFHLVTRDLQIVDLGAPVQDLTGDIDIKAALVYPEENEVRFYVTGTGSSDYGPDPDTGAGIPPRPPRPRFGRSLPTDPVLVYNYEYQKWTVLTNQPGKAAALYLNKPAYLDASWESFVVAGTWSNSVPMKWETPWIKVNQLQDYGRFWEATFIGKYLSDWADNGAGLEAGDLKVTVKYDYEGQNGSTDVYTFRANTDFDPSASERLQFSVSPGRQKCQAIKFILEEQATTKIVPSEPTYTNGRGFELTGVDLVYGAKVGSSKTIGQRRSK